MPLSEATERKPMHQRTLEFQGFARADGSGTSRAG